MILCTIETMLYVAATVLGSEHSDTVVARDFRQVAIKGGI